MAIRCLGNFFYISAPDGTGGVFFQNLAGVARWRYAHRRLKVSLTKQYLVQPDGSPPATADEVECLKEIYPGAATLRTIGDVTEVLDVGRSDCCILHRTTCRIPILPAHLISLSEIPLRLCSCWPLFPPMPIVAASSGLERVHFGWAVALFTEMSSWSDRYIECGAGAFIGSLWEIRVPSASLSSP